MYQGLLLPNGALPSITNNRQRAQDAECMVTNQQTKWMFLTRLMNLAISVFEWKNLPDGVDARMLEWWLLRDGFAGFFYDEALKEDADSRAPEGFAVLPMVMSGNWDIYEYPRDRRMYAVNGFNYQATPENSVIVFNSYLRTPMMPVLDMFATRLADAQRTVDINIRQQRTARVIRCDEKQRLSYLNAAKEVDEGRNWVHGDKSLDLGAFQVFDVTTPYVGDKVQAYKHQIWNEALTYIGIENVNTDKKERLITDEVINSMGDVEAERFTRLNARKRACEEINGLFGLDVSIEFKSGQYIRTDASRSGRIETDGMRETGEDGE